MTLSPGPNTKGDLSTAHARPGTVDPRRARGEGGESLQKQPANRPPIADFCGARGARSLFADDDGLQPVRQIGPCVRIPVAYSDHDIGPRCLQLPDQLELKSLMAQKGPKPRRKKDRRRRKTLHPEPPLGFFLQVPLSAGHNEQVIFLAQLLSYLDGIRERRDASASPENSGERGTGKEGAVNVKDNAWLPGASGKKSGVSCDGFAPTLQTATCGNPILLLFPRSINCRGGPVVSCFRFPNLFSVKAKPHSRSRARTDAPKNLSASEARGDPGFRPHVNQDIIAFNHISPRNARPFRATADTTSVFGFLSCLFAGFPRFLSPKGASLCRRPGRLSGSAATIPEKRRLFARKGTCGIGWAGRRISDTNFPCKRRSGHPATR